VAYRSTRGKASAAILITPLVDVALVLLIVFMVITPMVRQGIQVNLPPAEHGEDSSQGQENQVSVSVRADRTLFVDLKPVSWEQLGNELELARRGKEDQPVLVKGDSTLTYGDIVEVMNACRRLGLPDVELVAQKLSGGAP
jgi:biopolymer transport protein ExbD